MSSLNLTGNELQALEAAAARRPIDGNWGAAYTVLNQIVASRGVAVDTDTRYWYQQAFQINTNDPTSTGNSFIRRVTQAGWEMDGTFQNSQQLQASSNLIGQRVSLVKVNHAGAPVGSRRLFARTASGTFLDRTSRLASHAPTEKQLLALLADACAECAAAGLPFTVTGTGGLFTGRADLPEPLATMSKHPLEALGNKALDDGIMVKARTAHTQASPKFLDVPDGPLAKGEEVPLFHGSRREALAQYRSKVTD